MYKKKISCTVEFRDSMRGSGIFMVLIARAVKYNGVKRLHRIENGMIDVRVGWRKPLCLKCELPAFFFSLFFFLFFSFFFFFFFFFLNLSFLLSQRFFHSTREGFPYALLVSKPRCASQSGYHLSFGAYYYCPDLSTPLPAC